MHCRLLTQYAIVMVQFLAGLRKIKLRPAEHTYASVQKRFTTTVRLHWYHPGGYSSMIWVGTCLWDLKSRPIFIPNFAEKWGPFLYQSHKFQAKITKIFTLFSKIVKLSSKFRKFWYQIDETGPIFAPILKIWPMFIPVFALNKGSSLYQEADFETHFSGTSPDRPLY